eukprot:7246191-Prymnesium_polylepis.1
MPDVAPGDVGGDAAGAGGTAGGSGELEVRATAGLEVGAVGCDRVRRAVLRTLICRHPSPAIAPSRVRHDVAISTLVSGRLVPWYFRGDGADDDEERRHYCWHLSRRPPRDGSAHSVVCWSGWSGL